MMVGSKKRLESRANRIFFILNAAVFLILLLQIVSAADVIIESGKVNVSDVVTASSFRMPTGAQAGYVLTSDASGYGIWQTVGGSPLGGGWFDAGTNIYLQTNTDNVGLGTTNPSGKFTIGESAASGANFSFQGHTFTLKGVNDPVGYGQYLPYIEWRQANGTRAMYLGWGSSAAQKYVSMMMESGYNLYIDGGNVGIGISNPNAKLQVMGDIYASPASGSNLVRGYGATTGFEFTDQGTYTYLRPYHPTSGDRDFRIGPGTGTINILATNGNVGIGTTNPLDKLNIAGGNLLLGDATNTNRFNFVVTGSGMTINSNALGNILFLDRVLGNVGIGTTDPASARLRVAGGAIRMDNNQALQFIRADGGDGDAGRIYLDINNDLLIESVSGDVALQTLTGNRVGIGTAAPSQKLDVSGQIHATGDICTDANGGKCLSNLGAGSGVPGGGILMFESACPAGWTRLVALDGRFPRGAASAGGTGGSASHLHTYNTVISHSHTVDPPSTGSGWISSDHSHSFSTGWVSSDHAHYFSAGTSGGGAHSHGLPRATSTDNDNYIWGEGSSNNNLPSNTYTAGDHGHSVGAWTGGINANHYHSGGTSGVSANHYHSTDIGAFASSATGAGSGSTSSDSSLPPYYDLVFCRKD